MELSSPDFLTALVKTFQTACTAGASNIMNEVLIMTFILGVIKIAWEGIMNPDQDLVIALAARLCKIGMFVWLAQNWVSGLNLTNLIFQSFQKLGIMAALGSSGMGETDPSAIGAVGITVVGQVLDSLVSSGTQGASSVTGMMGMILMKILLVLAIVICCFFMAIQLFKTAVEFYISSMLGMTLLPLGLVKWFESFAQKTIGTPFTYGIKMMVLQFIMCLSVPLMKTWCETPIAAEATPGAMLSPLLGTMALAILTWQAPNMAAGMLGGTPSLGGGVVSGAVSAAAGTASTAMRGAGMVYQATKATNGATGRASTMRNVGTMLSQSTPFGQGRQQGKSLLQNASQINSNNTDYNAFKGDGNGKK